MRILAVTALAAAGMALAPSAQAQRRCAAIPSGKPSSLDAVPPGFALSSRQAIAIARRTDAGRSAAGRMQALPVCGAWQVLVVAGNRREADISIDGRSGRVLEAWGGYQASWPLARGSGTLFVGPGMAVILPVLALLFLAPFFDPRRPLRATHLDLLALLAVGVSLVPFALGDLDVSTPLAFLALGILLVRLLLLVRRPGGRAGPLCPYVSPRILLGGTGLLLAGRAAYNALVAHVSDVGYLSVFGAQALLDGFPVYSRSQVDLDAYGPFTHIAYVPFTAVFPLPGGLTRGGNEAAHAAAITFDVLTTLVLYAVGRRLRPGRGGHALGAALAFAWVANPIGFYPMAASTNDGLVALLVALGILALASPVERAVASGLAAAAKWVPIVLAPLFAAGRRRLRRQEAVIYALVLGATLAAVTLPLLPAGGFREMYDVSLGDVADVRSPFSIWGLWALPDWARLVAMGAAGVFAVMTAFVPRERSPAVVAALAASILVAVQMALPYWIYAYAAWFVPVALMAVLARHEEITAGRSFPRLGRSRGVAVRAGP